MIALALACSSLLGVAQDIFEDSPKLVRSHWRPHVAGGKVHADETVNALANLLLHLPPTQSLKVRQARASQRVVMQFDTIMETLGMKLKKDADGNEISKEEEKEIEERTKNGKMTFKDYRLTIDMMDKGAMVQQLVSKFGGGEQEKRQFEETQKRFKSHKKYLAQMDDDELNDPSLLLAEMDEFEAGRPAPRLKRIAEAAEATPEEVSRMIFEFDTMRLGAKGLSSGKDPETIQKELQDRQKKKLENSGTKLNRQQRRMMKKQEKKQQKQDSGFR